MDIRVEKILAFLTDIGIHHRYTTLNEKTFLPGIKVVLGTLLLDLEKGLYLVTSFMKQGILQ
ncbi:hypothetical protein [Pseudoalteromonas arctica]|uniref:hypothetical protein n=1 Tax=Pseudoalteromonas arctica TaxID=394751 RepID=UPI0020071722|nr:hypothetical protein [Pseudoalteromonas arctica]